MNNAPLPTPAQLQLLVNGGIITPAQQAAYLQRMGQPLASVQPTSSSAPPPQISPAPAPTPKYDPSKPISASNPFNYADLKAAQAAQQAVQQPTTNGGLAPGVLPPGVATEPDETPSTPGDPANASPSAGAPRLTAPPGMTPGAARGPGSDVDDKLARFVSGGAASGLHARGMSAADREYASALGEEGQEQTDVTQEALGHLQTLADSANEQSRMLGEDAAIAHQEFVQQKQRDDEHRNRLVDDTKRQQSRLDAALAQAGAQGIDPNRYYGNMSTPQKIGAAVAIGLGAFGAHALGPNGQGGQNYAGKIIEDAITQDIDAQRTNLSAKLDVIGKRMGLANSSFEQQSAMLAAERDSTMSAYTVASNDIARRAATFQGNADAQTKLEAMRADLIGKRDDKVAALNDRLFALYKAAEQPVGGAGISAKEVRERAQAIADKAHEAGHEITPEDARAQAAREFGLVKGGANPELAKPAPGEKGAEKGQLASVRSALDGVNKLIAIRQNAGVIRGADKSAEASAIAEATRTDFAKGLGARLSPELLKQYQSLIPGDPLEHNVSSLVGQDPTMARLQATKRLIETHAQQLQAGGGGAAPPDDALERDEVQ